MAIYTSTQLVSASNATYTTNGVGGITGATVRALNVDWVSSSVLIPMTSSMTVLSASFAATASLLLGTVVSASHANNADTASYVITAQTASYVVNAISASRATSAASADTASYVLNAVSASFAVTASYVRLAQSASVVASVVVTSGSANQNWHPTFTTNAADGSSTVLRGTAGNEIIYNPSSSRLILNSGSVTAPSFTGSLQGTATSASYAATASSVIVTNAGGDASYAMPYLTIEFGDTQPYKINSDGQITYNPVQNILTAQKIVSTQGFTGSLQGTASYAATASRVNPLVQDVQITGSVNVSGSLDVTGSIHTNQPFFVNNSYVNINGGGITPNTNNAGDGSVVVLQMTSTQSVGWNMFIDDTAGAASYDQINFVVESAQGAKFQDANGVTYALETWLQVPSNGTGTNPAPQFTRGLEITGSLTIQSGSGDLYVYGHKQFNVGAFQTNISQSGSANVSQSVNFEITDLSYGVSIASNSRITVANAGVYSITFSAQLLADAGADTVRMWLKKNGTNVPESTTKIVLRNNEEAVMTVNFVVEAAANDYYELAWQSANGDAVLLAENASGNYPAIPSVILTVTQAR